LRNGPYAYGSNILARVQVGFANPTDKHAFVFDYLAHLFILEYILLYSNIIYATPQKSDSILDIFIGAGLAETACFHVRSMMTCLLINGVSGKVPANQ
jgi:hypothetical protein